MLFVIVEFLQRTLKYKIIGTTLIITSRSRTNHYYLLYIYRLPLFQTG